MTRASTQARLDQALTRLLAGQPTTTDGALTVSNLCREAGVGRDSYYRSPQTFRDTVAAAQANRQIYQPELVALREEIAKLKREQKQTARDQAATVRELEERIRVYANQIQVLALRNAELQGQLQQLHHRLVDTDPDVVPFRDRT